MLAALSPPRVDKEYTGSDNFGKFCIFKSEWLCSELSALTTTKAWNRRVQDMNPMKEMGTKEMGVGSEESKVEKLSTVKCQQSKRD